MTTRSNHVAVYLLAAAVLLGAGAGCDQNTANQMQDYQQQINELTAKVTRLEQQVLSRDARISDLEQQVVTLQALGPGRVDNLIVVDQIELASLTGGADYDGQPGDDGITVYVRPLDADGHVLKAAGEIIVELLDASTPGQPRSLGKYVYNDTTELRKLWHGGMLTDHYTIRCPWTPTVGPPKTADVLIQVTFYDFLTGKRFSAAEQVAVAVARQAAD